MTLRGAFVDANGVRWDSNFGDHEGYLNKKSQYLKEWRKRYFILKGSKMFFSKTNADAPHGMIDLVDCVHVTSADGQVRKQHALIIRLVNEEFFLCAESENDKDIWLTKIAKAIRYHSAIYVDNQE